MRGRSRDRCSRSGGSASAWTDNRLWRARSCARALYQHGFHRPAKLPRHNNRLYACTDTGCPVIMLLSRLLGFYMYDIYIYGETNGEIEIFNRRFVLSRLIVRLHWVERIWTWNPSAYVRICFYVLIIGTSSVFCMYLYIFICYAYSKRGIPRWKEKEMDLVPGIPPWSGSTHLAGFFSIPGFLIVVLCNLRYSCQRDARATSFPPLSCKSIV